MADKDKKSFFGNLLSGIAGGLPGFLLSTGSSLLSNIGAKKRQQRADQTNIDFWKMQNQYNTPAAQMQRLKDAGLNPNLIYGSSPAGASGSAGSIAPSKAAPYAIKDPSATIAQMQLLKSQKDNLDANTVKIQEDGFLTKEQKEQLSAMRSSNIEIASYEAQQKKQKAIQELYNTLELKNSFQKRVDILSELVKQHESTTAVKELDAMFAREAKLRPNDPWYLRGLKNLWDVTTNIKDPTWWAQQYYEGSKKYRELINN